MKEQPLVSVLMTVYNREKYIQEAIESVLSSTYTNFELIIVDDQSSDRSVEIVRAFAERDNRISVFINNNNLGDYANRNKAASYAKGKYLKYVDSDDAIYPETLEIMVSIMETFPEAGFGVSSRTETGTTIYSPEEAYRIHFNQKGLLDYGPTGAIIIKEKFELLGGFKPLRNIGDVDFWMRMAARFPMIEMPKELVFWREHEQQEIKLASDLYITNLLPLIKENLYSSICPLPEIERKSIYRRTRKSYFRNALVSSIKQKRPGLLFNFLKLNY